ncbi:MAG: hypothetical protein QM791_12810 [Ferruginibacter sp.]
MTACDNISSFSQEQLTRIKLLGKGIVCGFEVFRDTQCFISITQGIGVTSEGHIICMADKKLKYYREYKDPSDYFRKLMNCGQGDDKKCTLYELLEHSDGNAVSIVPQNINSVEKPFLEGKVVLLYLENDNVIRILLIDEKEMWSIVKCCVKDNYCFETGQADDNELSIFDKDAAGSINDESLYNAVHKKYMLQPLYVRRFGYGSVDVGDLIPGDNDEVNLVPESDFSTDEKYFQEYERIIDEALRKFDDEIDKLHGYFGCMIDACHCGGKETTEDSGSPCNPVSSSNKTETGLQTHNIKIFKKYFTYINIKWGLYKKRRSPAGSVQYFYDFINDLTATYNELLDELCELVNDCCSDTSCFPRHLMIGRIKEEVSFQPSLFRQGYEQPPVYNNNANRLQQIRFLHWRMVIMMKCFFIPDWETDDFSDESYYDVLQIKGETKLDQDARLPVRITPSRMYDEALGKRAIPFYYNLSNSPYSLQYYWDNFSTKHNRENRQLSFFRKEEPGYTDLDVIIHPFVYSIDKYPFYRIEGHTGENINEVTAKIEHLRNKYRLNFYVETVRLADLHLWLDKGAEHKGGVLKGGVLILVYKTDDKIVADFSMPYISGDHLPLISADRTAILPPPDDSVMQEKWDLLNAKIGIDEGADDLKKIKGISKITEDLLNNAGITTYRQLSKIENEDEMHTLSWKMGKRVSFVRPDWIEQAKQLL